MKFILHEVKLWFNNDEIPSKSFEFLPNRVNVITGDATTGKTSFWRIIDFCLMSNKVTIPNTIIDHVSWFGLRFTINNREISIARKSPTKGAILPDVFFGDGALPQTPVKNAEFLKVKSFLDEEFGINDQLRYPYGKEMGQTNFNLSFRHFLLFNCLTEDIIGSSETYFDTTFFGKEEYEKALKHIFDMVIGVNKMENIKAQERIQSLEREIKSIMAQDSRNVKTEREFVSGIFGLVNKLRENGLVDEFEQVDSVDYGLTLIDESIANTKKAADHERVFQEIDSLNKQRLDLKNQIRAVEKYKREIITYKANLKKSADSLKPIEYLNNNLSDQLLASYETKRFIDALDTSLKEIQETLSKQTTEPLKVDGDAKVLKTQLSEVEKRIDHLNQINKNFQTAGTKFMIAGEVKAEKEQILKKRIIKPTDSKKLKELRGEKEVLEKNTLEIDQVRKVMKDALNRCIQRNYDKLVSLPTYRNSETLFNDSEMILQLKPNGQIFTLENVGSKSNYMLMHLCFYLGLHEHIMSKSPEHVPQFLFIDQPSIPYYASEGNKDRSKLIDAFSLLNSFIKDITEDGGVFQIFMVEHAPKEYWINNGLAFFHTVEEFINGKGIVPQEIFKD